MVKPVHRFAFPDYISLMRVLIPNWVRGVLGWVNELQWLAASEAMKKMDHHYGAIRAVVTRRDCLYMESTLNL